jgi:1,2-diacylglycerol 3-beta-galactosyltransferase
MVLMSDTGGGHRASAEALKAAFHIKFGAWSGRRQSLRSLLTTQCWSPPPMRNAGNKYDVSIVDLWSNHAPWPVNQLPKS